MKGLNKFLKNKNTVTILGVIACLVILFVGYNIRINQKTALVTVYYANTTIQPKTLITEDMVSRTQVPESFILGKYYKKYDDIIGKYSNYNTMISEGSLFYYDLLVDESSLPDAVLYEINEGERLVSFPANTETTYGNSIMPGNIVDVYVKLIEDGRVIYGEYLQNVEVLGVKDSKGKNVFENTDEERQPAYVYFSLPEAKYLLYSSMNYMKDYFKGSEIEIILVPNTQKFDAKDATATEVTSDYLYKYTLNGIKQIDNQKELYEALLNEMENQQLEKQIQEAKTETDTETKTDETNQ